MAYKRKTVDELTLQGNCGHGDGWEDLTSEETRKEINARLREYRQNAPSIAYRIIVRRVKIDNP